MSLVFGPIRSPIVGIHTPGPRNWQYSGQTLPSQPSEMLSKRLPLSLVHTGLADEAFTVLVHRKLSRDPDDRVGVYDSEIVYSRCQLSPGSLMRMLTGCPCCPARTGELSAPRPTFRKPVCVPTLWKVTGISAGVCENPSSLYRVCTDRHRRRQATRIVMAANGFMRSVTLSEKVCVAAPEQTWRAQSGGEFSCCLACAPEDSISTV